MVNGLESASRSLSLNEKKIGSIVNNLANINSTGYKRELPFEQLILNNEEMTVRSNILDFTQGELVQTDNPLDLAISGDAFFVIENNNGDIQFTKNGKFKLSEDGYLVDARGNKVLGENGEVLLQEDFWQKNRSINISLDGEIFIGEEYLDRLKIVKIEEKNNLIRTGNNNYRLANGFFDSADPEEYQVAQGYLESSNVNPIVEMEEMIRISKEYESAQKMIQYLDEIMGKANEIGNVK